MLKLCCMLFVVALVGCTHDTGGLYGTAPDPAPAPAQLPLLPFRTGNPDTDSTCAACAKDACAAQRDYCLQDDDCMNMLACKGKCSDPACLQACAAKFEFSAWFEDLWFCALDECSLECNAGENFACVGQYNWPVATRSRFPVRLNFNLGLYSTAGLRFQSFLVGAAVRACPSSPCTDNNLIDSGRVDATNSVSLDLIGDVTGRFPGFLEIEDPRSGFFGVRKIVYPEPLSRAMELGMVLHDSALGQQQTGGLFDLQAGASIAIQIRDCLGWGARNVRFELPALPDVKVGHFIDGFVYGAEFTSVGAALVPDVPEIARQNPIRGRAVQVGTDVVVAEAIVEVRSGWITELLMQPRAR